jgi:HD-GYP domain-containing protein (c-di-GMP phosphodiesterase class II)/ABC-type amino acid transport substrate-binding protein
MHTTIRLTVVTVFLLATMLTAGLAIGLQYYFSQSMAKQAAADLYTTASDSIAAELRNIGIINANVIDLLADNPYLSERDAEDTHLETFIRVLEKNPLYYGVYLGHSDGSFFEVINLDTSDQARRALRALPSDRWLVVTVDSGAEGRKRHFRYLDENLAIRVERSEPTEFEVTNRPWFTGAMTTDGAYRSAPYLFAQLGVPGRTLSRRINHSDSVVAVDMTLSSISELLRTHKLSRDSEIYLYNGRGDVIASSVDYKFAVPAMPVPKLELTPQEQAFVESLPTLKVSNEMDWPPFDYTRAGEPRGYSVDVIKLIAQMTGLQLQFINGFSWEQLVEKFRGGDIDLLHPVAKTTHNSALGLFGSSFTTIPFALATPAGRAQIHDLSQMKGGTLAIPGGWSVIPILRNRFPDLNIVETENTLEALQLALEGDVDAALDNEVIIRYIARHYFLDNLQIHPKPALGKGPVPDRFHIVVSEDQPELRAIIDRAIDKFGPTQREHLAKAWLNMETEQQSLSSSVVPSESLIEIANTPALAGQLVSATINGESHIVYAAPTTQSPDSNLYVGITTPLDVIMAPFVEKVRLSLIITAAFMLLLMPLSWFFANPIVRPIKQLATENNKVRRREYDDVVAVKSYVKELDELSESMVSMVKAIQAHELAQRELMDSFIKLIAQAIDDKSAYTGGHCERVPELALMLAEHASRSDLPAFRDFSLETDDQWREYRIAAWLHDCGKITTPEHIVDKGSKLEMIYNRIHEVRMRFEVLWRDAEIDYFRDLIESPDRREALKAELDQKQQKLRDDFAFVAECNVGGEFLDEEKQQRLRTIADITWQRYFDDRIGLSPVEELRVPPVEAQLPATENLLTDKPEHVIERTRSTDYAPELGINMDVPEHLYNQGEVYNLSISRGTLTDEDRFKINEHMISTIKMLESLPFPPELQNVPRYASTHHETMRGSGYPRKLPGEQLSIPERILAVADVFEALTASDRPYKKAKPVSVAIDILHKMVLDNHIDRDCFELFLREGVYLEYAQKFLAADQVDSVDLDQYLGD